MGLLGYFIAIVLASVALVGCAPERIVVREPVPMERIVYVKIDPSLTAACPIAMPRNDSGRELLRVARERRKALETCANGDKAEIARIQGTRK